MNIVTDKYLYHYTSFEGLQGILESKKLWLVSSLEMNDVTDRFYANLYALTALYSLDDPDIKLLRDNLTQQDILDINAETFDASFYSASFCANCNNEYLWEHYAKDYTGVAICFDKEKILNAINQIVLDYKNGLDECYEDDVSPPNDIIVFRKVLYGTPNDQFLDVVRKFKPPNEGEHYKTWYLAVLSVCAGMIKASAFEKEDEIRILFQNRYSKDYLDKHPFHLIYESEDKDVLEQLGLSGDPICVPKKRFELDLSSFWGTDIIPYIILGNRFEKTNEIKKVLDLCGLSDVKILKYEDLHYTSNTRKGAMYIEKKKEIVELIEQLEHSVASNNDDSFVKDSKCPSLVLWSKYQKYLTNVLSLFELEEKRDYENLEKVITLLELDSFYVDAKECYGKTKLDIQNYIQRIKERIAV